MNAGPSAQFVPFWKKPCQCYGGRLNKSTSQMERKTLTMLVDFNIV